MSSHLQLQHIILKTIYVDSPEIGNAATWDIEKDVKSIVKSPLRNCILFGSKNCSKNQKIGKIRKSGKSENRGNRKIGEIGKIKKSGNR